MPLVIDGNNLLHASAATRSRDDVRHQVLEQVRGGGSTITVVFDGPPPDGSPAVEHLGRVTVHYSGSRSADDEIVRLLPSGRGAADWVVVTDDRGLGRRVRDRGARVRSLAEWRRGRRDPARRPVREPKLSSRELDEWAAYFAAGREDGD
jgi:hypothetical protein